MPDNNNPYVDISIKPGLDDNSLLALKLDTQQRLSKFSTPPLGSTVPSYNTKQYVPDNAGQGSIMGGAHSYYDVVQASISPDKNLRDAAGSIIAKNLDSDPVAQGVGGSRSIDYDPSMDKYLSKAFGYRPERGGVAGNEDFYYRNVYQNKSFVGKRIEDVYTGLGRIVVPAVFKAAEGLSYLGTMVGSIGSTNYWADIADNSLARWLTATEQKFKDQVLPVYHSIDYNNKGFFAKMLDPTFWTDEAADGVSFMASMVASNYGVGLLGDLTGISKLGELPVNMASLGKFGKLAGTAGKAADFLVKGAIGSDVSEIGRWLLNTASESAFEASQGYQTSVQTLKDARARGENNLTDSDIKRISGERASARFGANMMILSLSNAVENKFIFNPLFKKLKGADFSEEPSARLITRPSEAPENFLEVGRKQYTYGTKVGKFLNLKDPNSRLRFYGPKVLTTSVMEGFWEENAQLAAERLSGNDNLSWSTFWNQLGTQTKAALKGDDKEAAENIGLGALIGMFGVGVVGKAFEGNRFLQGERRKISEDTNSAIDKYNAARTEFLSFQDIWKHNEDGSIQKDEDGKFQVDDVKVKGMVDGLAKLSNQQEAAAQIELPTFRQHLQNRALADFVFAAKRAGIYGQMLKGFDKTIGLDAQKIEQYGFDPNNTVNNPADIKKTAEDYGKLYEQSENSRVKFDVNNENLQKDSLRKYALYKSLATSRSLQDISREFKATIAEQALPSVFSPEANAAALDVQTYNSLLYQKQQLQGFENYTKDHNDFYKGYLEAQQKTIDEQLNQLRPTFLGRIKDGSLSKDNDGFLASPIRYEGMSDTEKAIAFDQDHAALRGSAEVENSIAQNNYTAAKLSSPATGMENYNQYQDFYASVKKKDDGEVSVKQEKDGTFTVTTPAGTQTFDNKEEADKKADEVNTENQTITTQNTPPPPPNPTPNPPPGPAPTGENVDVVPDTGKGSDTVVDTKVVSNRLPAEVDPNKAVSYYTPLKTTERDTEDTSPTSEKLTANDYDMMRANFIKTIVSDNFSKKYNTFVVVDTFPEVYKEVKDNQGNPVVGKNANGSYDFITTGYQGEVIVVEDKNGNRPTVADFFPNQYKDYAHLPIVFSFNMNAFQEGKDKWYALRVDTKSKKEGLTPGQVRSFYNQEIGFGEKARQFVRDNPNDKVQIGIFDKTDGINPRTTSYSPVQERFGDFEFAIATPHTAGGTETEETFPGSGVRYPKGIVYAKIGRVAFPIATGKLTDYPSVADQVVRTLAYKFKTRDEAELIRNQFLNTVVHTSKRKNFFTIDLNQDGTYSINYRISKDTDFYNEALSDAMVRRAASVASVSNANLNVSREALKDGYRSFDPATGTSEFLGAEDYTAFIKPKLRTDLKKIVDQKGNLYGETVNPYYSFVITDPRIRDNMSPEEKRQQNFDKLKDRIEENKKEEGYDINKVKTSLESELKKNNIDMNQYNELIDVATPKMSSEDILKAEEKQEEQVKKEPTKSVMDKYKNKEQEDVASKIMPAKIQTFSIKVGGQEYIYDSYANKIYLFDKGVLVPIVPAAGQYGQILGEFAKQYPYSESEAGNTGFNKLELVATDGLKYTIYAPPTTQANSDIVINDLTGTRVSTGAKGLREELAPDAQKRLDEYLEKYCK